MVSKFMIYGLILWLYVFKVKNGREILPFESCFEDEEHNLMLQCFQFQRRGRPKLCDVKSRLCEMIENAGDYSC